MIKDRGKNMFFFVAAILARSPLDTKTQPGLTRSSPFMKHARGVRQRLGIKKDDAPRSHGAKFLSSMRAAGKLSADEVCTAAKASCLDAASSSTTPPADIRRMARARATQLRKTNKGSRIDTRNTSRNLQRVIRKHSKLPPVYMAQCPIWDTKLNKQIYENVAFCPPHEVLDAIMLDMCEDEYCSFDASQSGVKESLEAWGERVHMDVRGKKIACFELWGDAAPFNAHDSLFLLVWTLLSGSHRDRYWFCGIPKTRMCQCGCYMRHTMDAAFAVLAWSFRAFLSGFYPRTDHNNRPFLKGWRAHMAGKPLRVFGALVAKNGDWQWHKAIIGLCGWRGEGPSKRICFKCPAGFNGDCPPFDFTDNACWRARPVVMSQFLAAVSIPGAVSISTVRSTRLLCNHDNIGLDAYRMLGRCSVREWKLYVGAVLASAWFPYWCEWQRRLLQAAGDDDHDVQTVGFAATLHWPDSDDDSTIDDKGASNGTQRVQWQVL